MLLHLHRCIPTWSTGLSGSAEQRGSEGSIGVFGLQYVILFSTTYSDARRADDVLITDHETGRQQRCPLHFLCCITRSRRGMAETGFGKAIFDDDVWDRGNSGLDHRV